MNLIKSAIRSYSSVGFIRRCASRRLSKLKAPPDKGTGASKFGGFSGRPGYYGSVGKTGPCRTFLTVQVRDKS